MVFCVTRSGTASSRGDDKVIDSEVLGERRAAAAERQLHGVQTQHRAAAEAEVRPRTPRYTVQPEHLARVRLPGRVQPHPELELMPPAETQCQRRHVALGPVAIPSPARYAVGL